MNEDSNRGKAYRTLTFNRKKQGSEKDCNSNTSEQKSKVTNVKIGIHVYIVIRPLGKNIHRVRLFPCPSGSYSNHRPPWHHNIPPLQNQYEL